MPRSSLFPCTKSHRRATFWLGFETREQLDATRSVGRSSAAVGRNEMTDPKAEHRVSEQVVTPRAAKHRSMKISGEIPVLASRVRARLLFMVLDAACVVAAYSAPRSSTGATWPRAEYGWHFSLFVLFVVIVTLVCNQMWGLYGRMWQHAGLEEARQMIFSTATVAVVLLVVYPLIRLAGYQLLHPEVVLFGLFFAAAGMSLIRFHSRIFAWQRGSRGSGLRVAIVGSRDAAASAVREMLRHPDAGLIPVAVFDDDTSVHGMSLIGVPSGREHRGHPRRRESFHAPRGAPRHSRSPRRR